MSRQPSNSRPPMQKFCSNLHEITFFISLFAQEYVLWMISTRTILWHWTSRHTGFDDINKEMSNFVLIYPMQNQLGWLWNEQPSRIEEESARWLSAWNFPKKLNLFAYVRPAQLATWLAKHPKFAITKKKHPIRHFWNTSSPAWRVTADCRQCRDRKLIVI